MIQILHDVFLGVLYAFGIGFVGFLALCLFGAMTKYIREHRDD